MIRSQAHLRPLRADSCRNLDRSLRATRVIPATTGPSENASRCWRYSERQYVAQPLRPRHRALPRGTELDFDERIRLMDNPRRRNLQIGGLPVRTKCDEVNGSRPSLKRYLLCAIGAPGEKDKGVHTPFLKEAGIKRDSLPAANSFPPPTVPVSTSRTAASRERRDQSAIAITQERTCPSRDSSPAAAGTPRGRGARSD